MLIRPTQKVFLIFNWRFILPSLILCNVQGLILVTDAISALGLEEGRHNIGTQEIEVKCSRAYIAGTTTLCGSISSMNECVQIFKKETSKFYSLMDI